MVCKFASKGCKYYQKSQTCNIDDGGPFSVGKNGEDVAYCGYYNHLVAHPEELKMGVITMLSCFLRS